MKKIIVTIFCLLLAGSALAQIAWQTVTPKDAGFAVDMPGEPLVTAPASSPLGERGERYLVDLGPTAFYVSYTIYPPDVGGPSTEQLLDTARNIVIASAAGKLRSEHPLTLGSGVGRELVVDGKDELVYKARVYVRANRVFRLITAGPRGSETNSSVARFFDSFRFTSQGG